MIVTLPIISDDYEEIIKQSDINKSYNFYSIQIKNFNNNKSFNYIIYNNNYKNLSPFKIIPNKLNNTYEIYNIKTNKYIDNLYYLTLLVVNLSIQYF